MSNNLKQVKLQSIDEGRFMHEINDSLDNLQQQVIEFSDKYGAKAKGTKAKLTIEVQIGCMSPDDGAFAFGTQIKQTLPSPPPKLTMAMAGRTENNKPRLFARASGSGRDLPAQRIICTEDGTSVDPDTGEVLAKEVAAS